MREAAEAAEVGKLVRGRAAYESDAGESVGERAADESVRERAADESA